MAIGVGLDLQKDILKPDGFRQSVMTLLLSTLAINILSLALPVMTLQVYDRILPNPGTGTLPILIMGVCLAIILEALLRLSRSYIIGRSGASYEHRMACGAMNKVLHAELTQMGTYGVGEHIHRMAGVGKLRDFYNGYALTVYVEFAFVPVFFALVVYIGQSLAIVPAVILGLFTLTSLWKGYGLRHALKSREYSDDKRFNFLIESLEGIHTIKAFALEKFFERRYEALEEDSTFANYAVTRTTAAMFNTGAIYAHLMVAAVISVGAWYVLNGLLTTGGLIAVLLLSGRMMQPVQKLLALWTRYQDYALARQNITELFTLPQQAVTARYSDIARLPDGRLEMQQVSFRYKNAEDTVFSQIDLKLRRGDAVLISGGHGAGKTTLLNVIAGLYPADTGIIRIDGELIASYKAEDLVRHIGYIRSHPLIFRGTIRDNITSFGQIDEARAREIASLMDVDKDVARLPGGFDTLLNGNDTDTIPPGLKQRIAIVRALATKPRLILFDNADRSLDKDGYAMMYSLLARLKGKVSMILVSEDKNICGLADRHYVLREGRLDSDSRVATRTNIRPYQELKL